MTVDFSSLLSKPVDDAVKPPIVPQGTYFGQITEYKFDETTQKKTPLVQFSVRLNGPGPDIDTSKLSGIDLTKRTMDKSFFLTEDSLYRLKDFLQSLGIQTKGRSFNETIPDSRGAQVMASIVHQTSKKNPDGPPYAIIEDLKGVQ